LYQPKDISALTEKRIAERLAREKKTTELYNLKKKRLEMKPPDIAAITQKRVEERLAREAARTAKKGTSTSHQQNQNLTFFKAHRFNETIRNVQDNADKLGPLSRLFDSSGPLPLAKPYVEVPDDKLSPSELKRREERRLREKNVNQDYQPPRKYRKGRRESQSGRRGSQSGGMKFEEGTAENGNLVSVESAELEAASPTVHAPQFNGPESISDTIEDFNNNSAVVQPSPHGQHLIQVSESSSYYLNPNIIDSLVGGDYSGYTSLSSTNNSTSPNALTVVNTAELALSHQRDYITPQRKRAIQIVKTLVGVNFVQSTKESEATA
jgi:hypothetical protein